MTDKPTTTVYVESFTIPEGTKPRGPHTVKITVECEGLPDWALKNLGMSAAEALFDNLSLPEEGKSEWDSVRCFIGGEETDLGGKLGATHIDNIEVHLK